MRCDIQFIFDKTEKDICFIIQRITETKIANQKLSNNFEQIKLYFLKLLQTLIKQPGLQIVRSDPKLDTTAIQILIICVIQKLSQLLQFTNNILTVHNFFEIIIQHRQTINGINDP